jgi:RNA polymerase sigma-70 factor (ECF subfamily)
MQPSDGELLMAWSTGDRRAGERLFRRYFAAIARFFRNKVQDQFDDLIQQTFAGCLENLARFRGTGSFRSYLFSVAHHVLVDHLRVRYRVAGQVDIDEVSLHDLAPGPSQVVAQRREAQVLLDALRRLPLMYQTVLELYFWEEMTSLEISEVLALPHGTVQTRLRRARELLVTAVARLSAAAGHPTPQPLAFEEWASSLRTSLVGAGL